MPMALRSCWSLAMSVNELFSRAVSCMARVRCSSLTHSFWQPSTAKSVFEALQHCVIPTKSLLVDRVMSSWGTLSVSVICCFRLWMVAPSAMLMRSKPSLGITIHIRHGQWASRHSPLPTFHLGLGSPRAQSDEHDDNLVWLDVSD